MTQKDQLKLLNAGFLIIREDPTALSIKIKSDQAPNWHRHSGPFKSKAELRRAMDKLLTNSHVVED